MITAISRILFLLVCFSAAATFADPVVIPHATATGTDPNLPPYYFTNNVPGCTNGAGGSFSYSWSSSSDGDICGKGWALGTSRNITYTGTYTPNGNSWYSIYGWTRSPLVEYLIVESFGTYNPSTGAALRGTVTCNGSSYYIYQTTRVNQPSIDGTQTFQQFWSVRQSKRTGTVSGTVDTGCHFKAWAAAGLNLGSHNYQILGVMGYYSGGTATFTVAYPSPL